MSKHLTLKEYQKRNIEHSRIAFPQCMKWEITEWTNAMAGEAGEACNLTKKVRRGDFNLGSEIEVKGEKMTVQKAILKELADVICYASILMSVLGADIEEEVNHKFHEVLARDEAKRSGIPIHEPLNCNT